MQVYCIFSKYYLHSNLSLRIYGERFQLCRFLWSRLAISLCTYRNMHRLTSICGFIDAFVNWIRLCWDWHCLFTNPTRKRHKKYHQILCTEYDKKNLFYLTALHSTSNETQPLHFHIS